MCKRLIMLLLFLPFFSVENLQAQGKEGTDTLERPKTIEMYILTGAGYSYSFGRDEGNSPMIYRGHSGMFYTGFYDYRTYGHHKVDIGISGGIGKQAHADVVGLKNTLSRMFVDYSYVHHFRKMKGWPRGFYLGGSFHTHGFMRYHNQYSNNFLNYEAAADLALVPMYRQELSLFNRKWHVDLQLELPFFAAFVRPDYVTPYKIEMRTNENKVLGFLKGIEYAGPGSYQRLQSQVSLNYFLKNGNSLMLTYRWNYYHIASLNAVRQSFHTIAFTTNFNLN